MRDLLSALPVLAALALTALAGCRSVAEVRPGDGPFGAGDFAGAAATCEGRLAAGQEEVARLEARVDALAARVEALRAELTAIKRIDLEPQQ